MRDFGRSRRKTALPSPVLIEGFILFILFILTFLPVFSWMRERFTASGTFYSHGPLIPFLVAYLIWHRKGQLTLQDKKPAAAGLLIVIAFLALHLLSMITEIHFISGLAMIGVILGAAVFLFGFGFTRRIAPALALLIFMVPMPRVLLIDTAFQLQLASAKATVLVLNTIGINAAREGVCILLPGGAVLEVAFACSGLRSLIVFIATAWIIIAMARKINAMRALSLLVLSIPMALASNVFRLVLTALATAYWRYSDTVHTASGLVSFVIYIIVMLLISRRLLWKEEC
ncbi:MAG: exosortase/archaeosortase family protein [Candidatus Tritonobacter lacicola]|nr:exosortase/archaeosortase family protein [Candidatus Tritonobacter lacicola]